MRQHAFLVMTMVALGGASACSDDDGGGTPAGGAGRGGSGGTAGGSGAGGASGMAGRAGTGGTGGGTTLPPPTPALPADAPTVACPTVINGAIETSDRSQTGRHSRFGPSSACGMTKPSPGNAADPSNPHLYDVYRFSNPGAQAACFTFTLSYGEGAIAVDGGLDAGTDAAPPEPGAEDAGDGGTDAGVVAPPVDPALQKYLTAYGTFFPTDISLQYLGDIGAVENPPTMGITVPAGGTVDVVVYAVAIAPAGVDSYTLSCSVQ